MQSLDKESVLKIKGLARHSSSNYFTKKTSKMGNRSISSIHHYKVPPKSVNTSFQSTAVCNSFSSTKKIPKNVTSLPYLEIKSKPFIEVKHKMAQLLSNISMEKYSDSKKHCDVAVGCTESIKCKKLSTPIPCRDMALESRVFSNYLSQKLSKSISSVKVSIRDIPSPHKFPIRLNKISVKVDRHKSLAVGIPYSRLKYSKAVLLKIRKLHNMSVQID